MRIREKLLKLMGRECSSSNVSSEQIDEQGPIYFVSVVPEDLPNLRHIIESALTKLHPSKESDLPALRSTMKGRIIKVRGLQATSKVLVRITTKTCRRILRHVQGIESVSLMLHYHSHNVNMITSEDFLLLQISREFVNGVVDLVPQIVIRLSNDRFVIATKPD